MRSIIFISLLLISIKGNTQIEKSTESKVTGVIIYLNRAQVTRMVITNLEAGKTDLVISGLSAQLDPESIQVSGKGSATIIGVSHRFNFLNEFNRPTSLKILFDSLAAYQKQAQIETNKKEVLEREEQMLYANQKFSGTAQNITVNELKLMSDFFRSKLSELVYAKSRQDDVIKKLNEKISRINRQITEQSDIKSRNTSEIIVSLKSEKQTPVQLELKYIVSQAGWSPIYDIKATELKNPISLVYKANVYQSSGEVWNDVKVTLSTGNPTLGGTKPELGTWGLNIMEEIFPLGYARPRVREMQTAAPGQVSEMAKMEDMKTVADQTVASQTTLNTEFLIANPQNIPSGSKPILMDIQYADLPAIFEYAAVPKLDKSVFLIAKATGWDDLNLLPGEANIFFEGTYVGKTTIEPRMIQDTIQLSMGRDPRIIVNRERVKELSSKKLIGSTKRELAVWKISVRNTKNESILLSIEDQIPVSLNSQIEISGVETQGAQWDRQNGKLIWKIKLEPSENKTLNFRYEIKFPKDKFISGL